MADRERRELAPWDPGDALDLLRGEFDRVFDRFFNRPALNRLTETAWIPPVDVLDEENQIVVKALLPEVNKDQLEVKVSGDVLSIRGTTQEEKERKNRNYYVRELRSGSFRRDLELPVEVDPEKISATYKNGVLTITLPKVREALTREVKVKVE